MTDDFGEPEEGDITTSDHLTFRQYGKIVLRLNKDEDMWDTLDIVMSAAKFWPNVWFISDHGNAHLMKRGK